MFAEHFTVDQFLFKELLCIFISILIKNKNVLISSSFARQESARCPFSFFNIFFSAN